MKTVARYLENDRTALDGSYISTLIKPTQVFLNEFIGYDATKNVGSGLFEADTTPFMSINERVLDPRITFTRASSAIRVNSSGMIEALEVDIPRLDYDPITLQPKGLLIE